jgi:hypothetical protein
MRLYDVEKIVNIFTDRTGCHDYQDMEYKRFLAGWESAGSIRDICETFTNTS